MYIEGKQSIPIRPNSPLGDAPTLSNPGVNAKRKTRTLLLRNCVDLVTWRTLMVTKQVGNVGVAVTVCQK